jgi:lipid-binding SYLF domain-containing protein
MRTRFLVGIVAFAVLAVVASALPASAQADQAKRIRDAASVFSEIMSAPDKAIPSEILERAEAVAVFPNLIKAGFVFGGQRGKGVLSVRNRETGAWSQPAFLTLTGGSWGAQIGGESIDLVLLIMNRKGVDSLVSSKFKIGGDASASAGPVGRSAEASTDAAMRAQILSYSRSRGLFAGVTINGSVVEADEDSNQAFYGQPYRTADLVGRAAAGTTGQVGTSGRASGAAPKPADDRAIAEWHQTLARHFAEAKR